MATARLTYSQAASWHATRLQMQATFAQLQAMEKKLALRVAAGTRAARYLRSECTMLGEVLADNLEETQLRPAQRMLALVQRAIQGAAERNINSHAVARQAARRGKARRGLLSLQEMQQRSAIGRAIFRASSERVVY